MNSILTALFVAACVAGTGIVLVRSPYTLPSNFGVILMAGGTLVGIGLIASLIMGGFILMVQTIFGS